MSLTTVITSICFLFIYSVRHCKAVSENDPYSPQRKNLSRALYELCDLVLKGQLKVETVAATIADVGVSVQYCTHNE